MNRTQFVALLLGSCLWLTASAAGYRWKDADGNTVFSQFPPPSGTEADRVKLKAVPAGAPPAATAAQPESSEAATQPPGKPQDAPKEPDPEALARMAELKRKNCAAARRNLEIYSLPHNRKYVDKDGHWQRMDENERQRRLADTRRRIRENCE
ncbi:MAG: DUF4124 domain-containing protein [Chromatiales bacterium]